MPLLLRVMFFVALVVAVVDQVFKLELGVKSPSLALHTFHVRSGPHYRFLRLSCAGTSPNNNGLRCRRSVTGNNCVGASQDQPVPRFLISVGNDGSSPSRKKEQIDEVIQTQRFDDQCTAGAGKNCLHLRISWSGNDM